MAGEVRKVTRTVICPRCRSDATLIYVVARGTPQRSGADGVVYLCPNMCTVARGEITALLDRDA